MVSGIAGSVLLVSTGWLGWWAGQQHTSPPTATSVQPSSDAAGVGLPVVASAGGGAAAAAAVADFAVSATSEGPCEAALPTPRQPPSVRCRRSEAKARRRTRGNCTCPNSTDWSLLTASLLKSNATETDTETSEIIRGTATETAASQTSRLLGVLVLDWLLVVPLCSFLYRKTCRRGATGGAVHQRQPEQERSGQQLAEPEPQPREQEQELSSSTTVLPGEQEQQQQLQQEQHLLELQEQVPEHAEEQVLLDQQEPRQELKQQDKQQHMPEEQPQEVEQRLQQLPPEQQQLQHLSPRYQPQQQQQLELHHLSPQQDLQHLSPRYQPQAPRRRSRRLSEESTRSEGAMSTLTDFAEGDGQDVRDAEKLLEDPTVVDNWIPFEDHRDELAYHQKRSQMLSVFVRAFLAVKDAGESMVEEFEQYQKENRELSGEVAYWKSMAEDRGSTATMDLLGGGGRDVACLGDVDADETGIALAAYLPGACGSRSSTPMSGNRPPLPPSDTINEEGAGAAAHHVDEHEAEAVSAEKDEIGGLCAATAGGA